VWRARRPWEPPQGENGSGRGVGRRRARNHIAAPPGAVSKEADQRRARYRARMDLIETLRSTGAVRDFLPNPIDDAVLYRVLDTARFAPSGGNRQGWRVIVVKDPEKRRALRDLYLTGWYEYLAMAGAGLVPWAPVTDRVAEEEAVSRAPELAEKAATQTAAGSPGMAEALDLAPAVLVLVADLTALAAVDRDHDRYTFAGGASIYPFAWNLLLAARAEGLGGVVTTMAIRREAEMRQLFSLPETAAVAAVIVLGRPVSAARRLRRLPVEEFTWVDSYGGAAFDGSA
jgi:nitroreductase